MLYKNHVSKSNTVSALFRLPRQNTTWQTCAWTEHRDRLPQHSSVFSGAVSTLKVKCHTQAYGRLHRDRSAQHIPWTRRSILYRSAAAFQPQCWRTFWRTNSHLSFIPSFHWFCFCAQRHCPCRSCQVHTSVDHNWTFRQVSLEQFQDKTHVLVTLKCRKERQDIQVARTVIAERGQTCSCHWWHAHCAHVATQSPPSLLCVSSLLCRRRRFVLILLLYFWHTFFTSKDSKREIFETGKRFF